MVKNNDDAEWQASMDKRAKLKKYGKVARTSMLAITMGMSWTAGHASAASPGAEPAAQPPGPQVASAAAPPQYTGNSLHYFKNVFLPQSKYFNSSSSGETAPVANNVTISGITTVGQTLSGTYDYSDAESDAESGTTVQWYRSDDQGLTINYTPIGGATGGSYTLTLADVGKYITFVVTPRASVTPFEGASAGSTTLSPVAYAPTAPTATGVNVSGSAVAGQTLSGTYTYGDLNSDAESGTTVQWYRSDDAGQTVNYTPISGATGVSYTLTGADVGKYITFVVTPRTTVAPTDGSAAKSEATGPITVAPAAPTASAVAISGTARAGQTLTGSYTYGDVNSDAESGTTFQWYRSDDAGQSVNYMAISGATGASYTLTGADVGKYLTFVVTPRTAVAPTDGAAVKSEPTARVMDKISSSSTTTTVSEPKEEEALIEVVAVKKNVETQDSAKLLLTRDKDTKAITLANFHFYTDGVKQSSQDASKKETIAVRAKSLKDAQKVYADISGDAVSVLRDNQQRLAVITGDVAIDLPTISVPVNDLVQQTGVAADKLKIEINIEKQPAAVKEQAGEWASLQHATVIGEPYKFSLNVNDGTGAMPIVQYGNRYAYQTIPIPEGIADLNSLGAVMLMDGKYVPVPVRIVDEGHALLHTPTNVTVMLIQRNEDFADIADHWSKDDVRLMANKGNVQGDAAGQYNPDQQLTRAEFADLLVKAFGLGHQDTAGQGPQFNDLPDDPKLKESIAIVVGDGLFNGITDEEFAPDEGVTREQMITVLMRFYKEFELESTPDQEPPVYTDSEQTSGWAQADVNAANEAGIITGYENATVRPLHVGTRAEATALIRRFLQKTNLIN
ncbi:S-layer homology domain-containing protein [Paenibacillus athensensis]|uniref:SLH domain-containing protein n=1 Tax=Paenibacillus athensensis TaxID=1967502 RepID=A0A4Y8PYM9_9BACL|nr:S-layer homology domain-containing protein [Paenibacillus athensensis]MCD1258027.1 S-layer homology domain-containing protein [Paenibacillus athensensis]